MHQISFANTPFKLGQIPELAVGANPIKVLNTGNDVLVYNGDTFNVTVWDDTSWSAAGIAWEVKIGSVSTPVSEQLKSRVFHCLIKDYLLLGC